MSQQNQTHRDETVRETESNHTRPERHDVQPRVCNHHHDDDAALMRGVRERRQDAFEALYDRHVGHVYNLCRRVTGNDATAEEAVIETFWEIWQRPDRYDASRGTVLTYLLMLARCRAIDRLRGENSTTQRVQNAAAFEASVPAEHDTHDGSNAGQLTDDDALLSAFDRLQPKCQDAVRLCLVQGMTTSEAAQALDVPLGTIKSRIRKSVIQMRQWLRTG